MPKARANRRTAFSREYRGNASFSIVRDSRVYNPRSTTENSSGILSRKRDSTKNHIRRLRGARDHSTTRFWY